MCEHEWKYKIGQGRWFKCIKCKTIGSRTTRSGVSEIIPVKCEHKEGCANFANHLNWANDRGMLCATHQHPQKFVGL